VKQLAARGDVVEAGARDPSKAKALQDLAKSSGGRVRAHACDVVNDASVRAFAEVLGGDPIDVLVNNGGVMGKLQGLESRSPTGAGGPGALPDTADMLATYDANALGALRVTAVLLPRVLASATKRVVQITSGMGSIEDNTSGGYYGYRMSKAALNMMNRSLSRDYEGKGLTAIVLNPGWVQTDMGGQGAAITVDESVSKMLAIIDALKPSDTGRFLSYSGKTFPY
jgi:NAD(P)-dependent dehydrogenase (short-subunit alcohol dehydrogenase family)